MVYARNWISAIRSSVGGPTPRIYIYKDHLPPPTVGRTATEKANSPDLYDYWHQSSFLALPSFYARSFAANRFPSNEKFDLNNSVAQATTNINSRSTQCDAYIRWCSHVRLGFRSHRIKTLRNGSICSFSLRRLMRSTTWEGSPKQHRARKARF
jgi:hypothetical protein